MTDGQDVERLPAHIEDRMRAGRRTGLLFHREQGRGTTGIEWDRGEGVAPNPLAEEIIARVTEVPFQLRLAGHEYEIRRVPGE
jgi:hypothetical protein